MHNIGANLDRKFRYPVVAGGTWPRNWLHDGGDASIVAVFRRSFYIRTTTGRLFCIGGPGLGLGPLNLIVGDYPDRGKPGGWSTIAVENGDRAVARRGILRIGRTIALDGAKLVGWSPESRPGPLSPVGMGPGLSRVISRARAGAPSEGLGTIIPRLAGNHRNSSRLKAANPVATAAIPAIDSLESWLNIVLAVGRDAYPPFPDKARSLIGLGPGLTPSGDDFLGGLMIGLGNLGKADIVQAIWLGLQPDLTSRTNLISIAHLEAAAAGMGHCAVHKLLLALRNAEIPAIDRAVTDISAIGHCSGWDTIAGLVLAIRLARDIENVRAGPGPREAALV